MKGSHFNPYFKPFNSVIGHMKKFQSQVAVCALG